MMEYWKAVNDRLAALNAREALWGEIRFCRLYQLSVDEAVHLLANKR